MAIVLLFGTTMAYSQSESGQFDRMDSDQNGRVTWGELHRFHPSMSEDDFQSADADKDGSLSHDECYHFEGKPRMGRNEKHKGNYGQGKGMGKGQEIALPGLNKDDDSISDGEGRMNPCIRNAAPHS